MRRILLVLVVLLLQSCAHAPPVLTYVCRGCAALESSGLCAVPAAGAATSGAIPTCDQGKVLVIVNWIDVSRHGAVPVVACDTAP